MTEEWWELLVGEKKSRIRINGEEHLRTIFSFISTGNTEEEEEEEDFFSWLDSPSGLRLPL